MQAAAGQLPFGVTDLTRRATENTMTAAGLGRSGAEGEAVANATMSQGLGFLSSILGYPMSSRTPGGFTETTTKQPGLTDWLGLMDPIGKGVSMASGWFGPSKQTTSPGATDIMGMLRWV